MSDDITPRIYLDTNIFIQAFENAESRLVEMFCIEPPDSQALLITSELTLAELLVHPYRSKDDRLLSLYENWTTSNDILNVGALDRETLKRAALLRSQNSWLKLPDAIHVSTAMRFECSHFLTSDKRLEKISALKHETGSGLKYDSGLEYLNPAADNFTVIMAQLKK